VLFGLAISGIAKEACGGVKVTPHEQVHKVKTGFQLQVCRRIANILHLATLRAQSQLSRGF
jgi:hypothetical protein